MTTTCKDNPVTTQYENGNYLVRLFKDGTKERLIAPVFPALDPVYPESIDLKITDYCDLNCPYCHEQSTTSGEHADLELTLRHLAPLQRGLELAIGGGNPLDHPDLVEFLITCKAKGYIPSITVNSRHLHFQKYHDLLTYLDQKELVYGIGISVDPYDLAVYESERNNVVAHVIAGIHDSAQVALVAEKYNKILILGYKQYGRGDAYSYKYRSVIKKNIKDLRSNLHYLLNEELIKVLSFDNAAIEQLKVFNHLNKKCLTKFYMGDDGVFTMYYDAVNQWYKVNSTSTIGRNANIDTIINYFGGI